MVDAPLHWFATATKHMSARPALTTAWVHARRRSIYRGMSIVCFWIPAQRAPSDVGDKLFIRVGSETKRVEGLKPTKAVMALFE